jgi:hypothetical protein
MKVSLTDALNKINTTRICVIVTRTRPKLLKKHRVTKEPCPFAEVERIAERRVVIGADYENCVNRQLDREGAEPEFKAEALWGGAGRHVPGNRFLVELVEHTSTKKRYLAFLPLDTDVKDRWTCEAGDVDVAALDGFLPAESTPNQGTEKAVFWRTVGVENVVQVRCGEIFDIVPEIDAVA